MMLFVNMFQYAWQPFFLQNAKEKNAKEMFSKVFTYFTLVGSVIVVGLSLFIADLAHVTVAGFSIIGSAYWGGLDIVPIILFAYLVNGAYVIFSAGIYIEEKSFYLPFIAGIGAIVNVVVNILLIPVLNIYGAAIATLAAYLVLSLGYYIVTQKVYFIKYEWDKIAKIMIGVFLSAFIYYAFSFETYSLELLLKIILLIAFVCYLYFIAVDKKEIAAIRIKLKEKKGD